MIFEYARVQRNTNIQKTNLKKIRKSETEKRYI